MFSIRFKFLIASLFLMVAGPIFANDVRLSGVPEAIEAGRAFTLQVDYISQNRANVYAPDLSALESDFEIVEQTQSYMAQQVNEDYEIIVTFAYELMPLREGNLIIPPLKVGELMTEKQMVQVMPMTIQTEEIKEPTAQIGQEETILEDQPAEDQMAEDDMIDTSEEMVDMNSDSEPMMEMESDAYPMEETPVMETESSEAKVEYVERAEQPTSWLFNLGLALFVLGGFLFFTAAILFFLKKRKQR